MRQRQAQALKETIVNSMAYGALEGGQTDRDIIRLMQVAMMMLEDPAVTHRLWEWDAPDSPRCQSLALDEGYQCALIDGHEPPHMAPSYGSWNTDHTFHSWGDDLEEARKEYLEWLKLEDEDERMETD